MGSDQSPSQPMTPRRSPPAAALGARINDGAQPSRPLLASLRAALPNSLRRSRSRNHTHDLGDAGERSDYSVATTFSCIASKIVAAGTQETRNLVGGGAKRLPLPSTAPRKDSGRLPPLKASEPGFLPQTQRTSTREDWNIPVRRLHRFQGI